MILLFSMNQNSIVKYIKSQFDYLSDIDRTNLIFFLNPILHRGEEGSIWIPLANIRKVRKRIPILLKLLDFS